MKKLALTAVLALGACGGGPATATRNQNQTIIEKHSSNFSCTNMVTARLAVFPPRNKSDQQVDLNGMDDILIGEMTRSKCFQNIERDKDKMQVLFAEMDRCAPDAPDRKRYDCTTFAAAGKQLGASHYVFADVIMVAPNVAAANLEAKFPAIGHLEANEKYAAVVMSVRAVDVSTGEVAASSVVHALVPSVKAGLDVGHKGFSIKAATESNTPMGDAIMAMLSKSVEDMNKSWHDTSGKQAGGAGGGSATN